MPSTYTLISSNVLTSSAASVTFSAIPSTYTDLVLRMSIRTSRASTQDSLKVVLNSVTTGILYSNTNLYGNGAGAASDRTDDNSFNYRLVVNAANNTANTFTNVEMYLPSYTASQNKPISFDFAFEDNSTTAFRTAIAGLFRSTSAISTIAFTSNNAANFESGSSFYLYGIKNS
jgi:hypothetical protein